MTQHLDLTRTEAAPAASAPPAKPPVRPTDLAGYSPPRGGGTLAGVFAGLVLAVAAVAVLIVWEKFAPETWRPTYLLGNAAGTTSAAEQRASMQATAEQARLLALEKARHEVEVKDYEARMAMLVDANKTQLELQRIAYEAQTTRATEAYNALFKRANLIANMAVGFSKDLIQQRVDHTVAHQGGKVLSSVVGDLAALAGQFTDNPELVARGQEVARQANASALREIDSTIGRPLPSFDLARWNAELPDPVVLMVELERMKPAVPMQTPTPPQREAKPPTPYTELAVKE
jgi:hypothetical protein